ncbi:winged helix-turn-helix transcriptional regulator [Micromonospora mangrovi]|uniref:Helix-turn-helix domain-containing protein n=2 Tax=Micromonospora TaxID=1873 RepID=A0AAU8HKW2_9ACTN
MLANDYPDQVCSVARTLEVVGERWTLLILRDVLLGRCRFDELAESVGVPRTVLTRRLTRLVEHGVLERRPYQRRPDRFEYVPTPKGRELFPVVALLMMWGDRHYPAEGGPPRALLHRGCGGRLTERFSCASCGQSLSFDQIDAVPAG